MTISFSGLASGLDTSSWIESLVALKRAKVTTLNTQRQEVLSAKETLTNIKSFFNNFRSTIQKITNTHLNPMTTNVFVQNIATSSDLKVLTAVATPEAEEGTYKVKVDKLATKTNASSGYKKTVTTTVTVTAAETSYLKHIGVEAGNIGVTVGGIKYNVEITEKDTIESFIGKLGKVGVTASYNESSGVFSMNIGINDIDDDIDNDGVDNTKIKEMLNLEGVKGYKTQTNLTFESVVTDGANAKGDTKLNELGVNNGEITIQANGAPYTIAIDSNTTLDSFVADLKSKHINAKYDESTGLLTFDDAVITDEGTTGIKTALGLEEDIFSQSQATDKLSVQTVITQVTTVSADTKLKDIGEGTAIEDGDTVVVTNSNNEKTTVTIGETTSVGELLSSISRAGLRATITSSGTIEISGGKIEKGDGSVFDPITALGLEVVPYTGMVTGNALSETVTEKETATLQSRLVEDLGVTKGYIEVTDIDGNKHYEKISSGQTISDFKSNMGNLGIYVDLDEETGVLSITGGSFRTLDSAEVQDLITNGTITESDAEYVNGSNLLQCFYGSDVISTDHIDVASTYSKTVALRQMTPVTQNANLDSKLSVIGLTTEGTAIFDVNGSQVTIDVFKEMSIENLRNSLYTKGIETEWDSTNSKLTIKNATLTGGTSDLGDTLGLTTVITDMHATTGSLYAKTTTEVSVSLGTKLEDFNITGIQSVTLHTEDGNSRTFDVSGETTIEGFLEQLNSEEEIASFENGVLTIDGGYISNTAIENALGLERTINGTSHVFGTSLTYTVTATATEETTLGNLISKLGTENEVSELYTLIFNSEHLIVDSSTTIDSVISQIKAKGGTATLDNSGVLKIYGGTLTGTVADALGFRSSIHTFVVSATGNRMTAYTTFIADPTTTFEQLGVLTPQQVAVLNGLGETVGTVTTNASMNLETFFKGLGTLGVEATISNGVISLTSTSGNYVVGSLFDSFQIGLSTQLVATTTVTETIAVSSSEDVLSISFLNLGMTDIGFFYEYLGGPALYSATIDLWEVDAHTGSEKLLATKEDFAYLNQNNTIGGFCEDLSRLTDGDLVAKVINGTIKLTSKSGKVYELTGTIAEKIGFRQRNNTLISCNVDSTTIISSGISLYDITSTSDAPSKISSSSNLSDITVWTNDTEEDITIYKMNSYGDWVRQASFTITEEETLADLDYLLGDSGNIYVSDGKVSISVKNEHKIELSSDLSKALSLGGTISVDNTNCVDGHTVNVFSTSGIFYTTTYVTNNIEVTKISNTDSKTLIAEKETTFDENAELGLLRNSNGERLSNYYIELSTGGYQFFGESSTVDSVIRFLKTAGYEASIVDNKLVVSSSTFRNFDITGGLGEFLMGESFSVRLKEGVTINTSTTLQENVENNMKLTTKLSDLGITNGNIVVYKDGVKNTITVDSTKTVQEFLSGQLGAFGIEGSVSDGTLSLSAKGVVYFETPESNASNLVDKMGLANWYKGDYSQNSKNISSISGSSVDKASANTKLKDLTDSAGNSLGITSGKLYVYQNGIRETIDIDAEDTLATFASKLFDYGITLDLSDGVLSLDGAGYSFVTTDAVTQTILTQTVTVVQTNVAAKGSTTFDQLGLNSEYINSATLSLKRFDIHSGVSTTLATKDQFNLNGYTTLDQFCEKLAELSGNELEASIDNNGRINITSKSDEYSYVLEGSLARDLGFNATSITSSCPVKDTSTVITSSGEVASFYVTVKDSETVTLTSSVSSATQINDIKNIDNKLTWAGDDNEVDILIYHARDGYSDELFYSVVVKGTDTIDDINRKISGYGTINTNGSEVWISVKEGYAISTSDDLKSVLALHNIPYANNTNCSSVHTTATTTTSAELTYAKYVTQTINTTQTITIEGLNSLVASNVLTKLGIDSWEEDRNSVSKKLTYEEDDLNKDVGATKLVDLKDSSGNSLGITEGAYYVYKNGVRHTETITADTTINELREKLSSYGLKSSVNNDGSISFTAYDNTYLATAETAGANSNIVATMFGDWEAVNIYTSDSIINSNEITASITRDTKLADINVADPANAFQAGYITVVKNGVQKNIELTEDSTVGDLMDELSLYGFESVINSRGELIINATDDSSVKEYTGAGQASNALTLLGIDPNSWIVTNTYKSSPESVTKTVCATRDTLLSDLEYFKNNPSAKLEGEYYIYKDGVKYTAMISSDETLGSFMETLASFGIQTSLINDNVDDADGIGATLSIIGSGDSYLAKSVNTSKASDVIDIFVGGIASTYKYSATQTVDVTSIVAATEDTLLSKFDTPTLKAQGDLSVTVDGVTNIVQITANETFGSFKAKIAQLGLEAILSEDGQFVIQSGNKNFSINTLGTANESKLVDILGLNYNDMGGFVSSTAVVKDTHEVVETELLSVANYASEDTALNLLNITGGSLTIYRDGQKALITLDPSQDFNKLREDIQAHFGEDVDLKFEEGCLTIFSKTEGVRLEIGAVSDTSNFTAITGMQTEQNGELRSARELYCVNTSSKITEAGIFRNGTVTEGSFIIGDATFNIDSNTTLVDIISQINASQNANATAYWDSVNAKLVIQSRATGASLINIEAGTSNFTDVMGLTTSEWSNTDSNSDGKKDLVVTKVNTESQTLGENAKFSINGTQFTSTSNTITSSVSNIKGLTIDLKGITNEEDGETTITVERDKKTVSNAISDIVDAYNELIKNVDNELSKGGSLDDQFGLKLLRNQIRNLMTGTIMTPGAYKSLSAIGVSIEKASASNISTENVDKLYFDEEKFLKAFDADRDAIKGLLIGTSESDKGIFGTLDETLDKALNYSVGYFQTAQKSYTNQISKISNQISKAETATDRYRERLEKKFTSMDLLISKIQNQYSSFLAT